MSRSPDLGWKRISINRPNDLGQRFQTINKRTTSGTQSIRILDRVLDKGIVIDPEYDYALLGIDVFDIDAHGVVASIDTYLRYAGRLSPSARFVALHSGPDQQLSCRHREKTSVSVAT